MRHVPGGGELQLEQGHVRGVEVDRLDMHRVGGQVAHHVAAAGRDRDQAAGRPQLQGRHVDLGVLPDLGIDQALEHPRDHALEDAALGGGGRLQGSVAHKGVGQVGLPVWTGYGVRGSD